MRTKEKISERAQTYWETLKHGDTIDAEQLFDVAKQRKDLNQDIKHIRSFLTRKFNDGLAFLITGQSPPTYRKLEKKPSIIQFCMMTFNSLPMGEKITTVSFKNRLPLKYQNKSRSVQNFLHRAKMSGALVNELGDRTSSRGRVITACKKAPIIKLPPMGKIEHKKQVQMPIPEPEVAETETKINPEEMASKIFDMKASDAGIAIFQTLYKLMEENESQSETIKALEEKVKHYLRKTVDLKKTLDEYQKKDKTFAELHGQKGRE